MTSRLYILPFFALVLLLFSSCSARYTRLAKTYNFPTKDLLPDYSKLDYWAAHSQKKDPSDSIPLPLINDSRDTVVDVFFLHPTSFTKKKYVDRNAPITLPVINAKTDYTSILYQASVFNQHARIFAPRYRQAHIRNFFEKDSSIANAAFAIAYEDIRNAFSYYMQHWNRGRPVIIAGHSQGSMLAQLLLKEFFEGKELQKQLVAVYIPGWPVRPGEFSILRMCKDSTDTGCICSWRTFRKGFVPWWLRNENGNSYVTNPLSWKDVPGYSPRSLNKGAVLRNFNRIYAGTTDAWIHNGLLNVHHPRFPWSFLYVRRNYHIGDINLFYLNLRYNIQQRINSYFKTRS
jgi:hypothetical protein